MQVTIERSALVEALGRAVAVVERRNTIPALSNVLLQAEDGSLTLTATDLDIEVCTSTKAQVAIPGSITVPAQELNEIARRAPEGSEIRLTYAPGDDVRLKVKAGRSNYSLPVLPAVDFPVFSDLGNAPVFEMPGADLTRMISAVRHATSTEAARYYLNGAYLHPAQLDGAWLMRLVSTDGNRLAMADMAAPKGYEARPGVIVPNKTLDLMRKLAAASPGEPVQIANTAAKIKLTAGDTVVTSKVIEGSYIDYARVLPHDGSITATAKMGAQALAAAVDAVSIVSNERARSVKFTFGQESLILSLRTIESGQADSQVDIELTGDPIELGFNGRYVNDVMAVAGDREVVIHATEPAAPQRLTLPADPGLTFVIMPLRV
jgi:DNA polymerase-3 subunit beta